MGFVSVAIFVPEDDAEGDRREQIVETEDGWDVPFAEPLEAGLDRYRRRHRHELRGHAFFIHDFATGRRLQFPERYMLAAAARDPEVALTVDAYATRSIKPAQMFAQAVPRAIAVNARHALARSCSR